MTVSKEHGGPAYPVCFEGGCNNGESPAYHEGMTLRDRFALQAMPFIAESMKGRSEIEILHLCANLEINPKNAPATRLTARLCYDMADAMLEARKSSI
jgi:hypothetical protein